MRFPPRSYGRHGVIADVLLLSVYLWAFAGLVLLLLWALPTVVAYVTIFLPLLVGIYFTHRKYPSRGLR